MTENGVELNEQARTTQDESEGTAGEQQSKERTTEAEERTMEAGGVTITQAKEEVGSKERVGPGTKKEEEVKAGNKDSDSSDDSSNSSMDIDEYMESEPIDLPTQTLISKPMSCLSGPDNPKTRLRKQRMELERQQQHAMGLVKSENNGSAASLSNTSSASNTKRLSVTFDEDVVVHTIPVWNPCGDTWYSDPNQGIIKTSGNCCLIQ